MAVVDPSASSRFEMLKRILVGRPMGSGRMEHTLLPKTLAIPVLSADCLSSVAYTVEATLLVLVGVSLQARNLIVPISIAVAVLMSVVVASYMQTVRAYRTSGGAYVVAKENLGTIYGLVAAGSLLIGYVLTVAVSVVAGVAAIVSAVPSLHRYTVGLSVLFVALITVANLRGVRESGILFAVPTYGFIVAAFVLIGAGLISCIGGCPVAHVPSPVVLRSEEAEIGLLVILQAFAVGSSALTGVEAISNAVTVFRRPQGRNAAQTLAFLGIIAVTLILGMAFLAQRTQVVPSKTASVVSIIARTVFPASGGGEHPAFYVIQVFTFAILVLAANTSFQGFPRLAALMARDGFLPRQFENLGDRLVYSNGMVVLAIMSGLLIWAFDADVQRLIPLYAIGVFTAFTLSQAGMVVHWRRVVRRDRERAGHWRRSLAINGVGAVITASVVAIIVASRFRDGVWVVIAAMPGLLWLFRAVRRHYDGVAAQLVPEAPPAADRAPGRARSRRDDATDATVRGPVVLAVEGLDAATAEAVGYVRSFAGSGFRALSIADGRLAEEVREGWPAFSRTGIELEEPPFGPDLTGRVLAYVRSLPREKDDFLTLVVPELFTSDSMLAAVRGSRQFGLKVRLLREPGVVVTDVPVVAGEGDGDLRSLIPRKTVALVFVSSVNGATLRAIRYARSLKAHETRAVFFALDPRDVEAIQEAWSEYRIPLELDMVEAPFRDMSGPVLEEVHRIVAEAGTLVNVILPEIVPSRWWHAVLHNQRALFLKRLLLFEPHVILSSVPYHLR